jgi:hypothetical protein
MAINEFKMLNNVQHARFWSIKYEIKLTVDHGGKWFWNLWYQVQQASIKNAQVELFTNDHRFGTGAAFKYSLLVS